jgi:hypothetical protein
MRLIAGGLIKNKHEFSLRYFENQNLALIIAADKLEFPLVEAPCSYIFIRGLLFYLGKSHL